MYSGSAVCIVTWLYVEVGRASGEQGRVLTVYIVV